MYPILFQIGPIIIFSHGVMVALGILIGTLLMQRLLQKAKLATDHLYDLIFYSLIVGIVAARLNYYLLYQDQFGSWRDFFAIWQGGLVSYGGFVAGFVFAYFWLKHARKPTLAWLDAGAIAFMLGLAISRIGCFLAGDLVGVITHSWIGLVAPAIDGFPRLPIALFYAIADLLIFVVLIKFYYSKKLASGQYFAAVLVLNGLARFILDFWREYDKLYLNLSISQWFSLLVFILGLILFAKWSTKKIFQFSLFSSLKRK